MSQTAITSQIEDGPRTVTLQNWTIFRFNSNISTTLEKIPIVDASKIWREKLEDRQAVAEEIRDAFYKIGFFYLIKISISTCGSLKGHTHPPLGAEAFAR